MVESQSDDVDFEVEEEEIMPRKSAKNTKKRQNSGVGRSQKAGKGGIVPPVERRFGQEGGNPRGQGFWKKEDTARYKLEQMMQLTVAELQAICEDDTAPAFEKKLARAIAKGEWKEIEGMINQVYGYPKQQIEQKNIEMPPPLSPRPIKTHPKKK